MDLIRELNQQISPVYLGGERYVLCRVCHLPKLTTECWIYGGAGQMNVGECYDCQRKANRLERADELRLKLNAKRITDALSGHEGNVNLIHSLAHYLKLTPQQISDGLVALEYIVSDCFEVTS